MLLTIFTVFKFTIHKYFPVCRIFYNMYIFVINSKYVINYI